MQYSQIYMYVACTRSGLRAVAVVWSYKCMPSQTHGRNFWGGCFGTQSTPPPCLRAWRMTTRQDCQLIALTPVTWYGPVPKTSTNSADGILSIYVAVQVLSFYRGGRNRPVGPVMTGPTLCRPTCVYCWEGHVTTRLIIHKLYEWLLSCDYPPYHTQTVWMAVVMWLPALSYTNCMNGCCHVTTRLIIHKLYEWLLSCDYPPYHTQTVWMAVVMWLPALSYTNCMNGCCHVTTRLIIHKLYEWLLSCDYPPYHTQTVWMAVVMCTRLIRYNIWMAVAWRDQSITACAAGPDLTFTTPISWPITEVLLIVEMTAIKCYPGDMFHAHSNSIPYFHDGKSHHYFKVYVISFQNIHFSSRTCSIVSLTLFLASRGWL